MGQELELFVHAHFWKRYWHKQIIRYLHGDVLEVGAGIGTNTVFLRKLSQKRWLSLEPDTLLLERLIDQVAKAGVPTVEATAGVLADLPSAEKFDAILYIDVLEHIEKDAEEFEKAVTHLKDGGRIIVLSPAHQFLYTPFDQALGHFRRYNKKTLRAAGHDERLIPIERMAYLDSVGMLASLGNRILLKQMQPTLRQILAWDRLMVPLSRFVDPLTFWGVGKSILGVWQKPLAKKKR